jgi:CubicO group peptidase (beta-lactamase class C family)
MIPRLLAPLAAAALAACATAPAPAPAPEPTPVHTSHAWATFDSAAIRASGAGGPADRATGRALTIDDPVRIASVSKLFVAMGVMRLVEQGKLNLDRDVSHWLGWPVRNPAFPDRPLTLRLLLSHTSSLRDDADYVIPLGQTVQDKLKDPKAFDAEHEPGTFFRYSNLNFPVVATVMEAASGERFDLLMRRLVLGPLGLDACFNWTTCSDAAAARAAVLYSPAGEVLRDDLKGKRPACPVVPAADGNCDWQAYRIATNGALFSPQGGLRISVRDLTKAGQMLLRRGWLPNGKRFLSEASVGEMLRPHWRHDGSNGESEKGFYCAYGLAVQILGMCPPGDDLFGDGWRRAGHAGDAYGLKSGLWIDAERGRGIAYFGTGIAEEGPRGRSAYWTIEEWLAGKARERR